MNNQYSTLSEAVNALTKEGYNLEFNLESSYIYCKEIDKRYDPDNFSIDEFHRFEGMTNPGDMSIVYAISTGDGRKGTLTDAYGTYGEPISQEMLSKLKSSEQ